MNEIEQLRKEIDKYNLKILELLNKRANVAKLIGAWKVREGIGTHDPGREAAILKTLKAHNKGPLDDEMIERIFLSVFAVNVAIQEGKK